MRICVVIPTSNRNELLEKCLESLRHSHFKLNSIDNLKVLIGFDGDVEAFKSFNCNSNLLIEKHLFSKITPAQIRNELIKKVLDDYDYLLFLDDDVLLPEDYFLKSIDFLKKRPDVFGGSDELYPDSNDFELALNLAIQSPFVTSATRSRHVISKETKIVGENSLTLSNLWIKSSIMKGHKFDSRYQRNEENVLIDKLIKNGKNCYHLADLYVHHKRRTSKETFLLPSFWSGYYRMKSCYEKPSFEKLIYLVPPIFIFFLLGSIFFQSFLFIIPHLIYLFFIITYAVLQSFTNRRIILFGYLILLQPLLVSSYAVGQLYYLIEGN